MDIEEAFYAFSYADVCINLVNFMYEMKCMQRSFLWRVYQWEVEIDYVDSCRR